MTNLNSNIPLVPHPNLPDAPRQFGLLAALWRAPTFSRTFYQDVGLRWRGIGMRYIMILLALSWLAVSVKWTLGFTTFIHDEAPGMLSDFPPITIKGGHASSPVKQPYIMKERSGHPVFVLDTTGATKLPSDVGAQFLLTADDFIQEQAGRKETHSLRGVPDVTIDSSTLLSWMKIARNLLIPVIFPILWTASLAYRMIAALILAAIGLLIAKMCRTNLSYAALLRLSMMSMTTGILIGTLAYVIPFNFGCSAWFLGIAIAIGYLTFGIKACARITGHLGPAFPVEMTPLLMDHDPPTMLP